MPWVSLLKLYFVKITFPFVFHYKVLAYMSFILLNCSSELVIDFIKQRDCKNTFIVQYFCMDYITLWIISPNILILFISSETLSVLVCPHVQHQIVFMFRLFVAYWALKLGVNPTLKPDVSAEAVRSSVSVSTLGTVKAEPHRMSGWG